MLAALFVAGLLYAAFYFIDPKNMLQVFGLGACIQIFNGITAPILWSMVADTADDAELRSGRRMVGLTTSSIAFAQKFGLGMGGALAGFLLAYYGYQANVAQTPRAVHGLVVIMSLIPAAGKAIAMLILWFYPLTQARLDVIQHELREQRERNKPPAAGSSGAVPAS